MPAPTDRHSRPRVGIVGAGQLARMMGEAADAAGVSVVVLAAHPDDPAAMTCDDVIVGEPRDLDALRRLASRVDVVTFDHELVELDQIAALEAIGIPVRPSARALRFAVDKAFQRETLLRAGIRVPRFLVVRSSKDERLEGFLDQLGAPPVVKSANGGYDGRGVAFSTTRDEALTLIDQMSRLGEVVVEERIDLLGEVAQLVARSSDGSLAFYPAVTTVQRDAMCVEVRYPSELDARVSEQVRQLSARVANLVEGVGVMAIEYFITERGPIVNELALRPHNSGHWTIEGAQTSQFTQHLRAVSGQTLGDVTALAPFVVMVNVVGGPEPNSLRDALAVEGVFVHDYAKSWRPGRKLGHVTALGDDPTGPHVRAWTSARAYGTVTQEA